MAGEPGAAGGAQDALRQPEPIRVLIVDDHALFRRGLQMVLAEEADIEVVGEASDGAEAVEKAGQALPDVVLMDIRMPRSSGIEACRAMKELSPSAKIVMLTISDEEEDLFEAIRAGASGYLLKDIPYDEVADVVRAVHGGQSLINPSMAAKLLAEFAAMATRDGTERAEFLRHGSVVGIPRGYHPVCAAPGYRLYYLWALVGAERQLAMYEDPAHRWLQD